MRRFKPLTREGRMILLKNGYQPADYMILSEDNRYIHFIPKGSKSVVGVMIYDKVDEEFVNSVKKKKKKRS